MISYDAAMRCLKEVSSGLRQLSYDELRTLARRYGEEGIVVVSEAEGQPVYIDTVIQHFGRIRKRVSVEMTVMPMEEKGSEHVPFIYFERFQSGRLYPSEQ